MVGKQQSIVLIYSCVSNVEKIRQPTGAKNGSGGTTQRTLELLKQRLRKLETFIAKTRISQKCGKKVCEQNMNRVDGSTVS